METDLEFTKEYYDFASEVAREWTQDAKQWAIHRKISIEDYRALVTERLQNIVDECDVYIRLPDAGTLRSVVETGRFQSGFERQGRFEADSSRREVEAKVLGIPRDVPDTKRPIYGYLSGHCFTDAYSGAEHEVEEYGDIVVRLRHSVRGRSTVCVGDSMVKSGMKASGRVEPRIQATTLATVSFRSMVGYVDHLKYLRDRSTLQTRWYLETHIRGVNTCDIASVMFKTLPTLETQMVLKNAGIEIGGVAKRR